MQRGVDLFRDAQCKKIFGLLARSKEGLTTKQARESLGFQRLDGSSYGAMPKGTFHTHTKHLIKYGYISREKNKKKAPNCKTTWHARLDPEWEQNLEERDTGYYSLFKELFSKKKLSSKGLVSAMPHMIFLLSQIYAEALYFLLVNNDLVQYNAVIVQAEKRSEELRIEIEKNITDLSPRSRQELADNFHICSTFTAMDSVKRISHTLKFPKKKKIPYDIRAELDLTYPTMQLEKTIKEALNGKDVKKLQNASMNKLLDENPNDFRKTREYTRLGIAFAQLMNDNPKFSSPQVLAEIKQVFEYYQKTGKLPEAMNKDVDLIFRNVSEIW